MHGRVKVRTTAEQDAAKAKERAEKLAAFRHLRDKLFSLKVANAAADQSLRPKALELSQALLERQPDMTTIWGFRRQLLEALFAAQDSGEHHEICSRELLFLNRCLERSYKSYGAWHHRQWTMLRDPSPPWAAELELCNKFLQLDSRNFHCWDYRRFLVKASQPADPARVHQQLSMELEFTTKKITSNFSNYSAWHYRSTLLPAVHPDPTTYNGISADAIAQEFDTVTQAVYIDAADQSAWFYHRWLVGRVEKPLQLCFMARPTATTAIAVFSRPVAAASVDAAKAAGWTKHDGKVEGHSAVWITHSLDAGTSEAALKTIFPMPDGFALPAVGEHACHVDLTRLHIALAHYHFPSVEVLERERRSCAELLEETLSEQVPGAPTAKSLGEQKWVRLSLVMILLGLDPAAHHSEIVDHLHYLQANDAFRRAYYADELSKMQSTALLLGNAAAYPLTGAVSLANKSLTLLHGAQHLGLASEVDLSGNPLRTFDGIGLLVSARALRLDDMPQLNTRHLAVHIAGLRQLQELSLCRCGIATLDQLLPLLALPAGCHLRLTGNPVAETPDFAQLAAAAGLSVML